MTLFLLGVNHTTAPIEIRERMSFSAEEVVQVTNILKQQGLVRNIYILSTCNRSEICCDMDDIHDLIRWIKRYKKITDEVYAQHFYCLAKMEVVEHLIRVASGLESLVIGEPQILGQMKQAVNLAVAEESYSQFFAKLFQTVFQAAKEVRSHTVIGQHSVSISRTAVNLATKTLSSLEGKTALLIGAGDTIELVLKYLSANNIHKVLLVNRNVARAQKLASLYDNCSAYPLTSIAHLVVDADVVISSTASPVPLVDVKMVQKALELRANRPLVIFDLAIPRDIDSHVQELAAIELFTIDDLQNVVEDNISLRNQAFTHAEQIIEKHCQEFIAWLRTLDHLDLLHEYRNKVKIYAQEVLSKGETMLNTGEDPSSVLARSLELLVNKVMHCPSLYIKDAAASGKFNNLKLVKDLYNLDGAIENKLEIYE